MPGLLLFLLGVVLGCAVSPWWFILPGVLIALSAWASSPR